MRDGYPKYTATYVFEWPGRSPDLHPVETLWQDLEIVVHGRSSSISLTELELFSKEEWPQRADSAGAELVETNADRLAALIAVKGGSTASNTRHFFRFFFFVPYCLLRSIFPPPRSCALLCHRPIKIHFSLWE